MLPSEIESYHVHHGDCIEYMATLPAESIDMSIFSPPFPSLYAYTSAAEDIGNSEDLRGEAKIHLSFFYRQFARILKPGRVAIVHVAQIPRMKRSGEVGLFDFRGLNIRLGERAGLVFEYDWLVRKNPQSQALRTKSRELQFAGLARDRAKSRGALPDYLLKFRAPGENEVPIDDLEGESEQTWRNRWIEWAEPAWLDIRETDTLNLRGTKGENDTKHICPLQLPVIDRMVRLYSNPGELVFSAFGGVGSESYQALIRSRRALACELKDEYYAKHIENCELAISRRKASEHRPLFPEDIEDAQNEPQAHPEDARELVDISDL
jgi:DNA modification methylase